MSSARHTAAAVGIAAVIAGLGGGAIYAATGGPHGAQASLAHGMPPGPPPGAGIMASPAGTLHGEFVMPEATGGYATLLTQNGTVTSMSPTSITVRSADDFTQTYAIPPGSDAARAIAVDDRVEVRGKRAGTTVTITAVSQRPGGPGD